MRALEASTRLSGVPWMHGAAPTIKRWKFRLVLMVTTTGRNDQSMFLTDESGQHCVGKCYTARPPGSLLTIAEQWARMLMESAKLHGMLAANMEADGLETVIALVSLDGESSCTIGSWHTPVYLDPCLSEMAGVAAHRLSSLSTEPHSLGGLCFVPKSATDRKWRHIKHKVQGKWKQRIIPATLVKAPTKGSGLRSQP